MSETGWLIEFQIGGRAVWWAPYISPCRDWTTDSVEAVRFARQRDAETVARMLRAKNFDDVIVTEHMWIDAEVK